MSELSASLTINLVERKPDEQAADAVFNLQVAEGEPSTPIHAAMLFDHDPPLNSFLPLSHRREPSVRKVSRSCTLTKL